MKTTTSKTNNGIFTILAAAGIFAFTSTDASAMPPSKTTPAVAHSKATKTTNPVPSSKRTGAPTAIGKTSSRPRTIGVVVSAKAQSKAAPYYKRKQSRP